MIRLPDDTLVFGSRWEGGVPKPAASPGANAGNWWDRVKSGDINLDDVKLSLSRIYAFDHFVHNVDRHCNNCLVRDQHGGYVVIAMDYSRAWATQGFPPPALPMNASTVITQRFLRVHWGVNFVDPKVIDRLRNLNKGIIEGILSEQLKADFAIRNGVMHVTATLDLRRSQVDVKEATLKAIVLDRASEHFGNDTRRLGVYAAAVGTEDHFRTHINLLNEYSDECFNSENLIQRRRYRDAILEAHGLDRLDRFV